MVASAYERRYSVEEFLKIAAQPQNETARLELEDGVIIEMSASSRRNTLTASRVGHFLNAYVLANALGYVSGPDGGYRLGSESVRRPDAGFIAHRADFSLDGVYFDFAPDLAVEVVSPDEDILKKANEYIRAGTRLVWALYAEDKTVYVFRPPQARELRVQILGVDDVLDGEDVLPGLRLLVRDLFPD